jgi:hypothetical protein
MADPLFLPFSTSQVSDAEAYVVRGRAVGRFVEISLSRDMRHGHSFRSDSYRPAELIMFKRFPQRAVAEYSAYAGNLETAARIAARGELGYTVHTAAEAGSIVISLVARLLAPDGTIRTEITHEQRFSDPDSDLALVRANEKAVELRAMAEKLNEQWTSLRDAHLIELRAQYEESDAQAAAATRLQQLVDDEAD